LLIVIALILTLPYYITVASIGPLDHGQALSGYLALLLMSATYIAIGLFASSVSNNQIVAFLLALLIGILFHIIFDVLAASVKGGLGMVFAYLSLSGHFESISRGVIDTKHILYFISISFIALAATEAVITRRNAI
ncbi:MAG TPA: hypothetical protein VLH16_01085, partial [Bacteroidales bacterium]|nr:hypothetical protein [Bacteroidales bacterium]